MTCIKCEEARQRMIQLYDRIAMAIRREENKKGEQLQQWTKRSIMVDREFTSVRASRRDRIL